MGTSTATIVERSKKFPDIMYRRLMVKRRDLTKPTPTLDDRRERRLTPESSQQPVQRLGNPLVRQLMDLFLVPGDDLTGCIPRRVRPVLAFQQHQRRLPECRRRV